MQRLQQNDIADPFVRGDRLTQAFLTGHPDLLASGFGPFYTATNLTVGSGQIRTNRFDDFPWTLREFKLALDGDQLKVVPFPTAEAPNGFLWDENSGLAQGPACRENFLSAMQGLLTGDLAQMSFVVDQACRDAESQNDFFTQDYAAHLSDGFRAVLDENLAGTGLSADDIANRARFAGSCIGCHNESSGANLGLGQSAPFSNDFVHVGEFATSDCGKRNNGEFCFPLSPALKDLFLPSRLNTLTSTLGVPIVPDPCGAGGSGGFGGSTSSGGVATAGGSNFGGRTGTFTSTGTGTGTSTGVVTGTATGTGTGTDPSTPPAPAPEVVIELPQASAPLSDLVQQDAEIRALSGDVTISGRSAQVTH